MSTSRTSNASSSSSTQPQPQPHAHQSTQPLHDDAALLLASPQPVPPLSTVLHAGASSASVSASASSSSAAAAAARVSSPPLSSGSAASSSSSSMHPASSSSTTTTTTTTTTYAPPPASPGAYVLPPAIPSPLRASIATTTTASAASMNAYFAGMSSFGAGTAGGGTGAQATSASASAAASASASASADMLRRLEAELRLRVEEVAAAEKRLEAERMQTQSYARQVELTKQLLDSARLDVEAKASEVELVFVQLKQARVELERRMQRIVDLESAVASHAAALDDAHHAHRTTEDRLRDREEVLRVREAELSELRSSQRATREQLFTELSVLTGGKQSSRAMAMLKDELRRLGDTCASLQQDVSQWRAEAAAAEERGSRTAERLVLDIQAQVKLNQDLEQGNLALSKTLEERAQQVEELEGEVARVREHVHARTAELALQREQIDQLDKRLRGRERQVQSLTAQLTAAESLAAQRAKQTSEVRQDLLRVQQERDSAIAATEAAHGELQRCRHELAARVSECDELSARLAACDKTAQARERKIATLRKVKRNTAARLSELQSAVSAAEGRFKQAMTDLHDLASNNKSARVYVRHEELIAKMRQENALLAGENERITGESRSAVASRDSTIERLMDEVRNANSMHQSAVHEAKRLADRVLELEHERTMWMRADD